jgi:transcriptional regulator with XRE-family HTH domain
MFTAMRHLRRYRLARQLTQAQLAQKVKISAPYLCQLEAGIRSPSLAVLRRQAKALGVPVVMLLD